MQVVKLMKAGSGVVLLAAHLASGVEIRAQGSDPGRVRARLSDAKPLSLEEIGQTVEAINQQLGARSFSVSDGAQTSHVDDRARAMLLLVLSGTTAVADLGVKATPAGTVRGLRSPATPPRSEVGASQILWIDVESLLPRRFEFLYDVPGMGDIAYNFIFD